jgi:hypothetical protein
MPVLINEVVVEVNENVVSDTEAIPLPQQIPMSAPEREIAQALALIEERRERLKVD